MPPFTEADRLGIVYVLSNPAMPGLVKIGKTWGSEVDARLAQLFTTGVPFPFSVEFACRVPNPDEVERALHIAFAPSRVNIRREFFSIEPEQAIAILRLLHVEEATAEVARQSEGIDEESAAAGQRYVARRRPNLNFSEMGIPIGARLVSQKADTEVTVCDPRHVRLGDEVVSLTRATRIVMGLDYNVNPGPYWFYEGRSINSYYNETYPQADD